MKWVNKTSDEVGKKRWEEWYNDFENMYPSSYEERHEELRKTYPNMYKLIEDNFEEIE